MACSSWLLMEASAATSVAVRRPGLQNGRETAFGEQVGLDAHRQKASAANLSTAEPLRPRMAISRGRAFAQGANGSADPGDAPLQPAPETTSISALLTDVTNLVKLVDSRDIIELELKHQEYEIVIRKETPQQVPSPLTYPGPHVMAHTSFPGYAQAPSSPSSAQVVAEPPPAAAAPAPPPPAPTKPSCPPMLSPMAGTLYRSPAPGEAAFVQVGDKVSKGQVVCIVEAMKLMNEIEADQSGTIVEILAEDGKPIAMESPLFLIEP